MDGAGESATQRFYGDLAVWWPLISPAEEYEEEAAFAATVIGTASVPVRDVLELGSGGHNAVHLKAHFAMTLVDLSEKMLEVSRRLTRIAPTGRVTCGQYVSVARSRQCWSTTRPRRDGGVRRASRALSGVDVGPLDRRHLDPDRVRLPSPGGQRLGAHRARDPPPRVVGRDDWLRLLADAGFRPRVVTEVTSEDRTPRDFFVGDRPAKGR